MTKALIENLKQQLHFWEMAFKDTIEREAYRYPRDQLQDLQAEQRLIERGKAIDAKYAKFTKKGCMYGDKDV